jgi:hypothetical protein
MGPVRSRACIMAGIAFVFFYLCVGRAPAEKLIVRRDGTEILGDVDPKDKAKFRTCAGDIWPIASEELKATDQKCKTEKVSSGGGEPDCVVVGRRGSRTFKLIRGIPCRTGQTPTS